MDYLQIVEDCTHYGKALNIGAITKILKAIHNMGAEELLYATNGRMIFSHFMIGLLKTDIRKKRRTKD